MLTDKKQSFINARLSGKGLADSYREAFDVENMNDHSIRVEAWRLEHNDPDVTRALKEGQKELAERAKWTRDEAIDRLTDVLDMSTAAIQDGDLSRSTTATFFSAYDRLNYITGVGKQTSELDVALDDMVKQLWS
ncbi:MAG: hypothetical protein IKG21_06440 [Atopobiaceae bacterium]|nr:hypothetical protein [Atopobiaceae bacterium]